MTPEEAVERIVRKGTMPLHVWSSAKRQAQTLIDECVATAKNNETRRCAARVKETLSTAIDEQLGRLTAKDLLVTGGLKVETEDGKRKGDRNERADVGSRPAVRG